MVLRLTRTFIELILQKVIFCGIINYKKCRKREKEKENEYMSRLEDITVGANVTGLSGNSTVSVIAVKWHGTNAMTVNKTAKAVKERLTAEI